MKKRFLFLIVWCLIQISNSLSANHADTYMLVVKKGSGSGDYAGGTVVQIDADSPPKYGVFHKWIGDTATVEDVNAAKTTLVMPEKDVIIKAIYKANLLFVAMWSGSSDDLSSVTLDNSKIVSDTLLGADFDMAAIDPVNNIYPWGNIVASVKIPFVGVTGVELNYKADKAFFVALEQKGLSEKGESYHKKVTASSSWKEVAFDVNSFEQPEWVQNPTDLDLTKVISLSFSPEEKGVKTHLELHYVYCPMLGEATAIHPVTTKLKSEILSLGMITPDIMNITVPRSGVYTLTAYTINGRLIHTSTNTFSTGKQCVRWDGTACGSQLLVITLKSKDVKFISKAVVQK